MKKIGRALSSMRFAIILLVLLAAACCAASFITQGLGYESYVRIYGERTAGLIMALHLDDAFHSWWFVLINAFLCCNLLFCNIIRAPKNAARAKAHRSPEGLKTESFSISAGTSAPESVFKELGLGKPETIGGGRLFAAKNGAGYWGAWICHLGVLLLILGFSLGQFTHSEYTAYGVPGQMLPVGDSGRIMRIDDFTVGLREDDTVEQYTSRISVWGEGEDPSAAESAEISVNHPAKLKGLTFYQNSTGWAAKLSIAKDGEPLQDEILCAGEYVALKDKPELIIYFNAFYPDYVFVPGQGPSTRSGALREPAYLYTVYYKGSVLGMNVLMGDEPLTIDEYTAVFTEPQNYTLIQAKSDRFAWLALIGGVLVLAGLFTAFYIQPVRLMAEKGDDGLWTVYGSSPRAQALFEERFKEACRRAGD